MSNNSSNPPPAVLTELQAHLQKVDEDPATPLDVKLLERCELYTTTPEFVNGVWRQTQPLFFQLTQLLPKLQQDPSPLNHFIPKLTAPYSFDQVKELDFCIGLELSVKPFHYLVLSFLGKAAASGNDAENLASKPDVVRALVRLWLCTDDTGIASKAGNLLLELLKVSRNLPGGLSPKGESTYGRGPMWKRLFEDKDVYSLFFVFCSLRAQPLGEEVAPSKRDKTIAQARIMEWLPRVGALDWDTITKSHHPDVEKKAGLNDREGLLHFATMKMADHRNDILMHISLINFFTDLIATVKTVATQTSSDSSLSLEFLKEQGLHTQMINLVVLDNNSIEQTFLRGPASNYVSIYASTYPENYESSRDMKITQARLNYTIGNCKPEDLHILASVPRTSLVPKISTGLAWDECPMLSIPIKMTNPDALKTLATVFHGPIEPEITYPPVDTSSTPLTVQPALTRQSSERSYARLLLSLYLTKYPSAFSDLVRHADTVAMKDNALAALVLLRAIITANWTPISSPDEAASDPILAQLDNFPTSGVEVILDPAISGGVLPYLLKPATTFSGLVGGRGDAESAAYQVAMAKFDVLRVLGEKVKDLDPPKREVDTIIRRRIAEGPWGVGGNVGARVGTLEM
ncbi:uncharacterized protein K441DRAFT_569433 [Cenococcum geophilum 1.58]|uniref:uncharacterized protein n=1 Tax=Cenococcum geophilum 1.58 TaxID=794803 RepID=UPI00358FFEE8|nr:hypothetical protein K441DRAFT_569433 [Cenococcum geophilum 1.58]